MKTFLLSLFAFTAAAMAQVKLSELPAASTLEGTEVFPTVQSATTKKATAAQIAEYANSVAAATFAPIDSPTFTGTPTVPGYQPLATPLTNFGALTPAAGFLTDNGSGTLSFTETSTGNAASTAGKAVVFGTNGTLHARAAMRTYHADATQYTGMITNGIEAVKNGQNLYIQWPATPSGFRAWLHPDKSGTYAMTSDITVGLSSNAFTAAQTITLAAGNTGLTITPALNEGSALRINAAGGSNRAATLGGLYGSATWGALYFGAITPSATNYTVSGNQLGRTYINAGTGESIFFAINDSGVAKINASGLTIGPTGAAISAVYSATAVKDFDLTAVVVEDQTVTISGAAVGDCVILGVPHGSVSTTAMYTAWVSATNTVTIRCRTSVAGENPASGTFRVTVIKN